VSRIRFLACLRLPKRPAFEFAFGLEPILHLTAWLCCKTRHKRSHCATVGACCENRFGTAHAPQHGCGILGGKIARDCDGTKSHVPRKLVSEMPEATNALHGDQISTAQTGIAKGVVGL
jgi:hypothetical protein